jgi:prophage maintenance system killer protein
VDGNKRVATVLLETLLEDNGFELFVDDFELHDVMMMLANGGISDDDFTRWVTERCRKRAA